MNNVAFQIYGSKKSGIFQSTWDTTLVSALGAETAAILASGTNWALNTGATNLNVGGYKHTAGSTTNLTTTLAATIMQTYQVTYTVFGRTAGSVTINYGGSTTSGITASSVVTILATATTVFSITPTSDFDGVISISVKTSSSATNQIKLPLPNSGTYNIWVDWGDGTYNNITSWNQANTLHTYPAPGIYTVRITGDRFNWQFGANITNDRLKIKSMSSWGKLKLGLYSFQGCSNLTLSDITDIPDLSTVTSLYGAFERCVNITTIGRINEWNMSNITVISYMFYLAIKFNSNVSNWNVSNIILFTYAFNSTVFNNGYASGIANQLTWNTSSCTNMDGMFQSCPAFNSNLGTGTTPWDVSKVTSFASMFNGASNFNNGDNSADINSWNINTVSTVNMSSMFNSTNTFNRSIDNWNMTKVNNTSGMFAYTRAFNQPLSNWERVGSTMANVIDMNSMFIETNAFNQDISNWNVSGVTNFSNMFNRATLFNNGSNTNTNLITGRIGIDGWNINITSAVNMSSMFAGAGGDTYVSFNRPIGNWNTSKVTNMSNMFGKSGNGNHAFNQYIGDWNTSSVTDMSSMFKAGQVASSSASQFNQDISKWDVSKVTDFSFMLAARQFNNGDNNQQNPVTLRTGIDGWNINTVSNVSMQAMFAATRNFNRNINNWNVSKVTNMRQMFNSTVVFNQPINSWDTSSVITMLGMFEGAAAFNQQIDNWNVTNVTDMSYMFNITTAFNQPLANWERVGSSLSKVTSMRNMFAGSGNNFNQNIGNWNVSNVTNFILFMNAKTPATFSYLDAIYNGWIVNGVKPNINISFGSAKYTSAGAAGRLTLTSSPNNWIIQDGGL